MLGKKRDILAAISWVGIFYSDVFPLLFRLWISFGASLYAQGIGASNGFDLYETVQSEQVVPDEAGYW